MDLLGTELTPLDGGYSGETFLAEVAGDRTVVRVYGGRSARRGANAAEVDAAVLRLVRGLLPVPEVLEVRRADPAAGTPALLLTSYLEGERPDRVLRGATAGTRAAIGRNLGLVLARLGQMPMLRAGTFVDGDLRIGDLPPGGHDLVAWVKVHIDESALGEWAGEDRQGLLEVAETAQTLLDTVDRFCLVHSDFNAKNILVDPVNGDVTGLLDWEFAHAGSPFTDLGNLLRFERDATFAGAVLAAYTEQTAVPAGDALDLARAADLWALVDLAARREEHEPARQAHDLLRAVARTRDLHAVPPA